MVGADIGRKWPSWLRRSIAIGLGSLLVIALGSMIFARMLFRTEVMGSEDGRFCVWPSMIEILRENGLAGIGPSVFVYYFPSYRDSLCSLIGTWEKAHNVYIEAAIAFGIPFAGLLFIAFFITFYVVFRHGLLRRKSRRVHVVAGIAAAVLVVIHSFFDFSIQIPAFAMAFGLFLGLTSTISLNPTSKRRSPNL